MKNRYGFIKMFLGILLISTISITSCTKDDNKNNNGKIDPGTIATANLIAYFPFENNGTDQISSMVPSGSTGVTYVAGRRGMAYQGADNAYLLYDLPAASKLKSLKGFTISMWFYGTPAIEGVEPVPGIFQLNGTTDPVWGNFCFTQDRMPDTVDSLNLKIVFHKEGAVWNNQFVGFPSKKFIENMWFHLVFTYDNVTSKYMVYVNGAPLDLDPGITDRWAAGDDVNPRPPLGDLAFANVTKFSIGGWMEKIVTPPAESWMGFFTGKIDELRIYDKGLSADNVKSLYEAEVTQLE